MPFSARVFTVSAATVFDSSQPRFSASSAACSTAFWTSGSSASKAALLTNTMFFGCIALVS
jgi:hypothetical protein